MWANLFSALKRVFDPDCILCGDTGWVQAVSCNDPFAGPCTCPAGKAAWEAAGKKSESESV